MMVELSLYWILARSLEDCLCKRNCKVYSIPPPRHMHPDPSGEKGRRAHIDGLIVDRADDIGREVVDAGGEPGEHEHHEQRCGQPLVLRIPRHLGALQEDIIDVVTQKHHRADLHKAVRQHPFVSHMWLCQCDI